MNPDRYCLVLVTAPSVDVARSLARSAVEDGLAACCTIIPGATSVYRWEGAVQEDAELQLLFKTTTDRFAALERLIRSLHPYEVPEIISVPLSGGSAAYLAWIDAITGGSHTPDNE